MSFSIVPPSFCRRTFIAGTGLALWVGDASAFGGINTAEEVRSGGTVALLTSTSSRTDAIAAALSDLSDQSGLTVERHQVAELDKAAAALTSLAARPATLVVVDVPSLAGFAQLLAAKRPNTAFLVNLASGEEPPRFVLHARGPNYRRMFRQGVLASRESPTGKIGLLGSFAVPETLNVFAAFCEGACMSGRTPSFMTGFSNRFASDRAAGDLALQSMIERRADVVLAPVEVGSATREPSPGVTLVHYKDPLTLAGVAGLEAGTLWDVAPTLRRIIAMTSRSAMA